MKYKMKGTVNGNLMLANTESRLVRERKKNTPALPSSVAE
jgi:hypothetical protein